MSQVLWNLGSLIVGAGVTWAVARYYYRRATNDLRRELGAEITQVVEELHKAASDLQMWITPMS
jgi:hypothetical protein